MSTVEVPVLVPGIVHFFGGIGTGIGKNLYRKKVLEPISVKIGTGKKYRYRYRLKFWVPSYSAGGTQGRFFVTEEEDGQRRTEKLSILKS